jgi:alkylation response protein AidB-like acyl-CoA dehydrogenase
VSATDTAELQAFREQLRAFLREHAPDLPVRAGFRSPADDEEQRTVLAWRAALYDAGYLGADWPPEWGGRGDWHPLKDLVLSEEVSRARLPPLTDQTHLAAFALIHFGTDEQKRHHLPAIREGRDTWCQLFSEPDAGSDLGAMRTRAVNDGDAFVVEGQKVWSSNAEWSDYGFLLARTGTQAERHRGITAFIVDMRVPGLEVRPLRELTGTSDFSEVFFDGCRLPTSAVLGEVGDGWRVAMESLGAERSGIGAGAARLRNMLDDLVALAREQTLAGRSAIEDAGVRRDLGRFAVMVENCNQLVAERLNRELAGRSSLADVPICKLAFSELNLEMAEYGMHLQSADVLVTGGPRAVADGIWQDEFLYARTYTVAGGSSEIMRNVIAERALGLPREARG